jgi:mannose-6-phosphate isomerase-like protein (cupin superfamily)
MTVELDVGHVEQMSPEERAEYDAQVYGRVIRFSSVRPTWDLSPNCRLPGHERGNFIYIGGGSYLDRPDDETIDQKAPAVAGENYSMVILLCSPGKGAPLHAHTTEETFMALTGRWAVYWGENAEHEEILEQWDAVSFPAPVMRGFRNVGVGDAYLMSVIGGGSPAPPINHPMVLDALSQLGLKQSWTEMYD